MVHRTKFKNRPKLISLDKRTPDSNEVLEDSQSTSLSSIGTSSTAPRVESTGKTSLDSKFSTNLKAVSQNSSEQKKLVEKKITDGGGSTEKLLTSIAEVDLQDPEPMPSKLCICLRGYFFNQLSHLAVITVEKAAAAKIFFECHYNTLLSNQLTPRTLRQRELEAALSANCMSALIEKDEIRRAWARHETNHLRETRVMRVRGANALKGKDITSSSFDNIKILGKGSFGVVRLVREASESRQVWHLKKRIDVTANNIRTNNKREIYAMKVIRKSDMLRNSQEGHLRAERDFLVSAEGSRW